MIIYLSIILFLILLYIILYNPISSKRNDIGLYGVNLGGIFLLEDWFFSDKNTTFDVATDKNIREGVVTTIFPETKNIMSNKIKFYGECDLINILQQYNLNNKQIYNMFQRHRVNYLPDLSENFRLIKSLGIKVIRLPVTWCIRYNKEYIIKGLDNRWESITNKSLIVNDPYFNKRENINWTVIDIKEIENILDLAYQHDLKILIDVHTYPGGQSDGSYSGPWPHKPRFWNDVDIAADNITTIMTNLYDWGSNLNYKRFKTLYGISPMNEPAHLRNIEKRVNGWGISDNDILFILNKSVELFRHYPKLIKTKKLVMNIIEKSIYPEENWGNIYGNWWKKTTSKKERETWAVIDVHHYTAWDDPKFCPNYEKCIHNIKNYDVYSKIRKQLSLDKDDLLYSSEFSASTEQQTDKSMTSGLLNNKNSKFLRNEILSAQLSDMKLNNVKGFFWNWSIPYNSNYQNEWSLKNIIN
jgi:hypothetical protein